MIKRICNMCGKEMDVYDLQENFSLHSRIGYGSVFDEDKIDIDLCCSCFDKTMKEYIIPNCTITPVTEEYR